MIVALSWVWRDLPVRDQHSLLKMAGDLGTRSRVVLSRAEIRELRSDPEKRYLLDQARRAAEGGTLLMVDCDPADGDFRVWRAALAPTFRDAAPYALALHTSRPRLKLLLHEFGSGDGLCAMVEKAITFCEKQDCLADMLAEVEEANPRRYARFEANLLA